MAFAREIILMIIQWLSFRIPKTVEKDSYYGEIGGTLIRISNHCTRLRVWDDMLEKNPKWKGKPIISIVFEDNVSTYDADDCLFLKRYRKNPIKVTEYVYNLNDNPRFIDSEDIYTIINSIRSIHNGNYTDNTGKCQPPIMRISQIPNLKDTKTALSNIEECINDPVNLNQRLENLKLGNTSFISDVVGATQKGNGESYYRTFIALDEKTVIEIRISEHLATKTSTLKKSNNLSQYLFQVVLLTPNTTLTGNQHINDTGQVGNLKVVTEKYFTPNSTINDMIGILKNIHDYLMNPRVYEEILKEIKG